MNLGEFKAWFEGFSEGIDEKPTAAQWKKIKAKMVTITPMPSQTIVHEYHDYWKRYHTYPWWTTTLYASQNASPTFTAKSADVNAVYMANSTQKVADVAYNARAVGDGGSAGIVDTDAMFRQLGRADAAN